MQIKIVYGLLDSYNDKIKYIIHISKTEYNNIIKNLNMISSIKIIKDIYTKK